MNERERKLTLEYHFAMKLKSIGEVYDFTLEEVDKQVLRDVETYLLELLE